MTETEARRWLVKIMRPYEPDFILQPIETESTGIGVPDLWWCARGGLSGWIELKQFTERGQEYVRVPWRPGQLLWAHRAAVNGVSVHLFLFDDVGYLRVIPAAAFEARYDRVTLENARYVLRFSRAELSGFGVAQMLGYLPR